jgi:hypothetical protein
MVLALLGLTACGKVTLGVDSGVGECTTQTWQPVPLANAWFDEAGGWTVVPLTNSAICESGAFGVPADTGSGAACFGIVNLADQTLAQTMALPPGTTQVRLRGKRCLVTTEPDVVAKDTLVIEIQDATGGQTLASLANWSNLDAAPVCAWTEFELTAPVQGTPESTVFSMHGMLDDLEITSFFLDTLEFDAFGC